MPILFVTVLIDLIGFGIIIPILPFMAPTLGASNFDIALIIAIYSIFGGLVGPSWGRLSDRIGRKPVLLICLGGAALSYVLLAFSTSLMMVYLARALGGIMSGNFGIASAMVADISTPENRTKSMGLIGAAFGLGMVMGPFFGGVLTGDQGNYQLACLVAAALSASAMLAGMFFLKESISPEQREENAERAQNPQGQESIWQMLRNSGNTLLVSQYLLNSGCHSAVSFLFPLWVGVYLGWGAKEVGIVFGALGLCMAMMQAGLIGWLTRIMGEIRLMILGTCLMSAGFFIAATANGQLQILIAFFATVTGGTVCTPVLNTLTANRSAAHLRGRMLGTTSSSSAFGRVLGPLLAGSLLSLFGFNIAWLGGTLLALLMVSWAISEFRLEQLSRLDAASPSGETHGR